MRREKIAPGEHYHVLNRGVGKQTIFHDNKDYCRFLFLILYFQSPLKIAHLGRTIKNFTKHFGQHSVLTIGEEVVKKRTVELVAFCIMPNHFHLIVKELEENGIANYMQRVLNAYAKYYNTKYEKSGHVFQGPYRAFHVEDDRQLLHLSAYIHRNVREILKWSNREEKYEWSSYQDFISENRWKNLLVPDIVFGEFENPKKYQEFVKSSPTKLLREELSHLENI